MRKRRKKFQQLAPTQTSFGGSLGFSTGPDSSYSSLVQPPRPTGNFTWNVDFINNTSIVGGSEFNKGVATLQTQVNRDFLPAWNIGAQLSVVTEPRGNATIHVLDSTAEADILGYHDISETEVPVGFVFALTARQSGDSWQNTASHELMELLTDPFANIAAEGTFAGQPAFFAYEVCDPVEESSYSINGIDVSSFVFPSWFIDQTNAKYDFLGELDAPFTIGAGGYMEYFRAVGDWVEIDSNSLLPVSHNLRIHPHHRKIHGKWTRRFRRRKRSNPSYGASIIPPKVVPHPHTHD